MINVEMGYVMILSLIRFVSVSVLHTSTLFSQRNATFKLDRSLSWLAACQTSSKVARTRYRRESPQWSLSGIHSTLHLSHLILWNGWVFPLDFTSALEPRRWTGNLQQKDYSKKQSISSFHLFLYSSYDLNILPCDYWDEGLVSLIKTKM